MSHLTSWFVGLGDPGLIPQFRLFALCASCYWPNDLWSALTVQVDVTDAALEGAERNRAANPAVAHLIELRRGAAEPPGGPGKDPGPTP